MVSSSMFSESVKQQYISYLKQEIQSETSLEWQLATNALNNDPIIIENTWQQIIDPNRELSYYKLSFVLLGFWSTLKISFNKEKYIQKYFDIIPEVMNN